jgi:hypothetical protein
VEKFLRWCRRNPLPAALLAGIVLVFLSGFAGVFWQWRVAETQMGIAVVREQEARQEADKAKKARDFLVSIFQISERDVQGGNITARQILADAERRISVEFAAQPELRGELETAIGKVKRGLGQKVPQAMILEVRGRCGCSQRQAWTSRLLYRLWSISTIAWSCWPTPRSNWYSWPTFTRSASNREVRRLSMGRAANRWKRSLNATTAF